MSRPAEPPLYPQEHPEPYLSDETEDRLALTWLRLSAETTQDSIIKETVREYQEEVLESYIDSKLSHLSEHHEQL